MDLEKIWIQLLLLVAVGAVTMLLTRSTADARHQAIRRILLGLFVVAAATSILFTDWLTWAANLVGVGRGADLLLYALVIAFLSYIATTHRRMNDLQRKITELTRQLAITSAPVPDEPATAQPTERVLPTSQQRAVIEEPEA